MYLLFPGRHHILTEFQYKYIFRLIQNGLNEEKDVNGHALSLNTKQSEVDAVIFAVTSSNHSGTKRNPVPFYLRAMMIQEFSNELPVPSYVYGIDDVGTLDNFAAYTIKTIQHLSDSAFHLTPENTVVICSTPVMDMYLDLGFKVLPAELSDRTTQTFKTDLPWTMIEKIVQSEQWLKDETIVNHIHASSFKIWKTYDLKNKVQAILKDPIIGNDGDITETRDYNSYVRQMDEIAELKYKDTSPYIKAGRIGDIGCAVGSWIKLACLDNRFKESDFYGIELARKLFDICLQRKHNGEFENPSVFFSMKNAVTSLVFEENTMNTIHTSSLTHEIESYGNRKDLMDFISNRYKELTPGGVWINRDVLGPENGDVPVYMELCATDGINPEEQQHFATAAELSAYLHSLSTFSRFIRFTQDFRKKEHESIPYSIEEVQNKKWIKLSMRNAAEYMLTKDYTDNWESEMHETFCFWSFSDWKNALSAAGFRIRSESREYQNPWIAENRWANKVTLYSIDTLEKLPNPPTNMILIGEKIG